MCAFEGSYLVLPYCGRFKLEEEAEGDEERLDFHHEGSSRYCSGRVAQRV